MSEVRPGYIWPQVHKVKVLIQRNAYDMTSEGGLAGGGLALVKKFVTCLPLTTLPPKVYHTKCNLNKLNCITFKAIGFDI